jgi:hypothetical protein
VRYALLVVLLVVACSEDSSVSRSVGARCDKTSECDDRCLAPGADYPGGFCTVDCISDGECPDGAVCIDRDGGICLFTCNTDQGCASFLGTGWTCHEDPKKSDPSMTVKVCRG